MSRSAIARLTCSGRKLTYLWHLHKGDIKTSYLAQKYIFNCNAWQLAILWQYNDVLSHTFDEIAANTAISKDTLKAQLQLLTKAKVLLNDGDSYDLNLSERKAVRKESVADRRLQVEEAQGAAQPGRQV